MDLRQIISDAMEKQGVTGAELARLVEDSMHRNTVYRFLRGEIELTNTRLGEVLDALNLKVSLNGRKPGRKK